jgi:hypothetical protein
MDNNKSETNGKNINIKGSIFNIGGNINIGGTVNGVKPEQDVPYNINIGGTVNGMKPKQDVPYNIDPHGRIVNWGGTVAISNGVVIGGSNGNSPKTVYGLVVNEVNDMLDIVRIMGVPGIAFNSENLDLQGYLKAQRSNLSELQDNLDRTMRRTDRLTDNELTVLSVNDRNSGEMLSIAKAMEQIIVLSLEWANIIVPLLIDNHMEVPVYIYNFSDELRKYLQNPRLNSLARK